METKKKKKEFTAGVRSFSTEKLKEIRKTRGVSQTAFAYQLGISSSTMEKLENNGSPTPIIAVAIAKALDMPIEDLLLRKPVSLEEYRWCRGLSATALAEQVGLSIQTVTAVESGEGKLTRSKALLLSQALNLTVVEVYEAYEQDRFFPE